MQLGSDAIRTQSEGENYGLESGTLTIRPSGTLNVCTKCYSLDMFKNYDLTQFSAIFQNIISLNLEESFPHFSLSELILSGTYFLYFSGRGTSCSLNIWTIIGASSMGPHL